MLFSVILLDGSLKNVSLAKHAKGRCLLEEVCRNSKLSAEMDYFGLKFIDKMNGQETWLNLRNQIRKQMRKANIYRLFLRVKYFVNQSQVIQDSTRHQMFLNLRHNYLTGKLILSPNRKARFHALLLRTEHGENALTAVTNHPLILHEWNSGECEALDGLRAEHARLKGVTKKEAEKIILTETEILEPTYGAETFHAINGHRDHVIIAVCRDAIRVYGKSRTLIDEYDFESGVYPSLKGNQFFIEVKEDYNCYKIKYQLDSKATAKNLHRLTVEFCTFFTHDTVSDWVLDSKRKSSNIQSLASALKRHVVNPQFKKTTDYNFDVIKTSPEVFEFAWKYAADEKAKSVQVKCGINLPRISKPTSLVFKFGPDTPMPVKTALEENDEMRTSGPYKKALKCAPSTPRIAGLKNILSFEPFSPINIKPVKQVFQFGPGTPRTPKPDKQVFQFAPGTSRTPKPDKQVFKFAPGTPRTPKPDQQVFQFAHGTPRTPKPDKQVFKFAPGTPKTPKPDNQVFQFESGIPRTPKTDKQIFQFVLDTPRSLSQKMDDMLDVPNQLTNYKPHHFVTVSSSSPEQVVKTPPNQLLDLKSRDLTSQSPQTPVEQALPVTPKSLKLTPLARTQRAIFKQRFHCKVCLKQYKNCAFVPCGHVVTCLDCSMSCSACTECGQLVENIRHVKYP